VHCSTSLSQVTMSHFLFMMRVSNLGCQADSDTVLYDGDPPAAHLNGQGISKRSAGKHGRTNESKVGSSKDTGTVQYRRRSALLRPATYRMTRRLTPDELDQVFELYPSHIPRTTGSPVTNRSRYHHQAPAPGRCRTAPPPEATPQFTEQVKQLYVDGYSLALSASRLGLTPTGHQQCAETNRGEAADRHVGQPKPLPAILLWRHPSHLYITSRAVDVRLRSHHVGRTWCGILVRQ